MFVGVVLYVVDNGGPQLPQMQSESFANYLATVCRYGTQVWVWDIGMGLGYRYGTQVWI